MVILWMIASVAIMWALGSWFLRASAWGALLLAAFWAYILTGATPGDERLIVATVVVICALQAVAFWLLGHYKYGLERGYWKSRIAYQLWPFRGGARWYRRQVPLSQSTGPR